MKISDNDQVVQWNSSDDPDYGNNNPLIQLIRIYEQIELAAEREHYAHEYLQALLPFEQLELYGPRSPNEAVLDVRQQDFVDFQKQNVRAFTLGDTQLVRGWVTVGEWTGAFLRVSYRGGPDSVLSQTAGHNLQATIRLHLKVGSVATPQPLVVPYNEVTNRYELEIWSYPGQNLREQLDTKGKQSIDRGELIVRTDLVRGSAEDFRRESVSDRAMPNVSPDHTMHPVNPLRIELAWADDSLTFWDSNDGRNYVYEFSMIVRGWDNYLKVGTSANPHGGIGKLEYRNLLSNYFEFQNSDQLGRTPAPWSHNAFGSKEHQGRHERFFAMDYVDLHIVQPNGGIGIHRHRDNQEIFMVLENEVIMITGDWYELDFRHRAFELRTLRAGHFALLKAGQLHGLLNPSDEDIPLLMFGGYD